MEEDIVWAYTRDERDLREYVDDGSLEDFNDRLPHLSGFRYKIFYTLEDAADAIAKFRFKTKEQIIEYIQAQEQNL
jgi:hypothetical protein